jgi:hypothetical protein
MKKPVRLLLLGTGLLVTLFLLGAGLAFHSGVQTWAARKALAGQPALKATVGKVSAGFKTLELHDLHFEQDGAVIELPHFLAEFSVIDAGLNEKVNLRRLVVKGWTMDLTKYQAAGKSGTPAGVPASPAGGGSVVTGAKPGTAGTGAGSTGTATVPADPAALAMQVFQGVFAQAALPFELTLDGVELDGDVKLPPGPGVTSGSAHVVLKGGGLAVGKEGVFTFNVAVALTGAEVPVSSLTVKGRLAAEMDTPRTFRRLSTQAEAAATGLQFPKGVILSTDVTAARTATGETYVISLSDATRLLAALKADLPTATRQLAGTWKLDLRDADLAPFSLGRALPSFVLVGEGRLDCDITSGDLRATGKLDAAAGKLGVIKPELAALETVKLVAEFDLARQGDALRVEKLLATFSGAQPVATVQALQAFEFNAKTGELKVAEPARELLGLKLQAVPLAWAQPWLRDIVATGGDLRGEFSAIARNGGFSLRPKGALTVSNLAMTRAGKPLVQGLDVSLTASADYTPQGWQMEVTPLIAKSGAATMLNLEMKVGQLAGRDQPLKATGRFAANLPSALAQPIATGYLTLDAGEATGDFVLSLDGQKQIQAKLALKGLVSRVKEADADKGGVVKLPDVAVEVRADATPGGAITLNAPIKIESGERKSDLTLAGTLTPGKAGLALEAQATSEMLVVDDVQTLMSLVPATTSEGAEAKTRDAAPPWAGLNGKVTLALKKVSYSDMLQLSDVTGMLSLEAGAAKLVEFRTGLGQGAEATIKGDLTFDAKSATPYALAAELTVNEFDPAPLFKACNPGQPATVEGKFSVASSLTGRAARLGDFATTTRGSFLLSSKGGVFRGLPVSYAAKAESTGKLAAGAAAIGNLISSMTSKKEAVDIASKAQAVAEMSKTIAAIPYDQLNVVVARDASLNTTLKDFTLISPEVRLSGMGQATYKSGAELLEQPVAMEFKLRARGRTAEVLKYLGKLEEPTDDLGYAGCSLPLKVAGSLGKPDTTELNGAVANLALEKAGVTEKASELLNKMFGGGK